MKTLAPPRRYRYIGSQRACAYCRHLHIENDGYQCQRPEGPEFSLYDEEGADRYLYTCDNWRKETDD